MLFRVFITKISVVNSTPARRRIILKIILFSVSLVLSILTTFLTFLLGIGTIYYIF